jgi:glycosyltransferase involved in cell wall biosynthesis
VVTASGGPKYLVVNQVNGLVTDGIAAFCEGVVRLAKNPGLRQLMGVRARDAAMCRYWNRIFDQVYDAYEYCLRMGRSAPLRSSPAVGESLA